MYAKPWKHIVVGDLAKEPGHSRARRVDCPIAQEQHGAIRCRVADQIECPRDRWSTKCQQLPQHLLELASPIDYQLVLEHTVDLRELLISIACDDRDVRLCD